MKDMSGKICGHWLIIGFANLDKSGRAYWRCQCELCGTIKDIRGDNLRRGTSTKCIHCVKKVVE